MKVILFILGATLPSCWTHVSLTYPPARNYALDFLDSARTKGPCGMPKGKLCCPYYDWFGSEEPTTTLVSQIVFWSQRLTCNDVT